MVKMTGSGRSWQEAKEMEVVEVVESMWGAPDVAGKGLGGYDQGIRERVEM